MFSDSFETGVRFLNKLCELIVPLAVKAKELADS